MHMSKLDGGCRLATNRRTNTWHGGGGGGGGSGSGGRWRWGAAARSGERLCFSLVSTRQKNVLQSAWRFYVHFFGFVQLNSFKITRLVLLESKQATLSER